MLSDMEMSDYGRFYMRNIKILDCTLRDGAQANKARFGKNVIRNIIDNLSQANIDIIECGFVKECDYDEECSYFPQPSLARTFLTEKRPDIMYAALMDYGRYNVDDLEKCDGKTFDLLRISFFEWDLDNVEEFLNKIKNKGYELKTAVWAVGEGEYQCYPYYHCETGEQCQDWYFSR